MDDKEGQIDEMGEAREAQYALECVLVRLTEAELQRVIDDLPQRALEHIRVTTAHTAVTTLEVRLANISAPSVWWVTR